MDLIKMGATKADGRFLVDSPEAYKQAVQHMADGRYVVTITTEEAKRSNQANRYLWGPIYDAIHDHTGQSKDDIHDEMCARFTTRTINYTNPTTGEIVEMEVVTRTSGMKVSEFHKFVEQVKLFAQEFFGLTFDEAPAEFHQERERAEKREKGRAA